MLLGSFYCDSVFMMFYSLFCKWLCRKFGFDVNIIDFVGYLLVLYCDDCFLIELVLDIVKRVKV